MSRRLVISLYVALALFTIGGALYYAAPTVLAPVTEAPRDITASLSIESALPLETHTIPSNISALAFLINETTEHSIPIQTKEYPGMGTLVETIGEFRNGTDSKYWLYYVNGTSAPVGADAYVVQEGDSIEWKYEIPPAL